MAERSSRKKFRPATTPEGRENQLISLASDLAERQLIDGSASAQVMTHFLKMGTERERLERQKIQNENLLLSAKVEQLASAKRIEELYDEALNAMREYKGEEPEYLEDDYYEDR
jgi:hypothetical protein